MTLESPSFVRATQPDPGSPAQLAEWIEHSAWADLIGAAPPALRAEAGLFVERAPGVLGLGASGIASLMVNRLFVGGLCRTPDPAALRHVLQRFAARGAPTVFAHVPAEHCSGEVLSALHDAGLERYPRSWAKLARDMGPVPEVRPPLPIGPCREADAESCSRLVVEVFGLAPEVAPLLAPLVQRPRWHVQVATDGGRVVAAGALYVQGELGWLGFGATAPEYRNRGLQRALLARRLRVARALGCRLVASETGVAVPGKPSPSYDNMQALGLRELYVRDNYAPVGAVFR